MRIMKFIEKDLEQIIWDALLTEKGREALSERGLDVSGKVARQFDIRPYGVIDLLTIDNTNKNVLSITIYELKKSKIDEQALMQACRYLTGIEHYLRDEDVYCDITIRLIGSKINLDNDFVFLYNNTPNVEIYTYEYSLEGMMFKYHKPTWIRNGDFNNDSIHSLKKFIQKGTSESKD